jgi:hypothetical protein
MTYQDQDKRPIRDNRGRFVYGHKPLRRPKYDLMQTNPRILCDTCYKTVIGEVCPEYSPNCVCACKRELQRFRDYRNADDVMEIIRHELNERTKYQTYLLIGERLNGVHDPKLSKVMNKNIKQVMLLWEIYTQKERLKGVTSNESLQ